MKSFVVFLCAGLLSFIAGLQRAESHEKISGVGVALEITPDGLRVRDLVPGSPAKQSHLIHVGDWLVAVRPKAGMDWIPTQGQSLAQVVEEIRGPAGTSVSLRLRHPPDPDWDVDLIREDLDTDKT